MALWVSLKRNQIDADIYYKGEKILTLKVNDHNRGAHSIIDLECSKEVQFKIIKHSKNINPNSDDAWNKEEFNK